MRKRTVSKFETRTATSAANLVDAAGYGVAGSQDIDAGGAPVHHYHERVALLFLAPLLALTAVAGVMFTLAG